MRYVVTGAAGFIGSTLVDALLARGAEVVGIDSLTPTYPEAGKRGNLVAALQHSQFRFEHGDLRMLPLTEVLAGGDTVVHLAGEPGVSKSWAPDLSAYALNNLAATHALVTAAAAVGVRHVTLGSSSSAAMRGHAPASPYGVSKLAAELAARAIADAHGLPLTTLRYFSVYGPRQRPDMAVHRLITAALDERPLILHGDGSQQRDLTYVDDAVHATIAVAERGMDDAEPMDVGSGITTSMLHVAATIGRQLGHELVVRYDHGADPGVARTLADTRRAMALLGCPRFTTVDDGITAQIAHQRASG